MANDNNLVSLGSNVLESETPSRQCSIMRERRARETAEQRSERLRRVRERRRGERIMNESGERSLPKRRRRVNEPIPNHGEYSDTGVPDYHLGPMNKECEHCKALQFESENNYSCCHRGIMPRHDFSDYPEFLRVLLCERESEQSKHFHKYILSYNSSVAFASVGMRWESVAGRGPPVLRCHGMSFHNTFDLNPLVTQNRQNSALYIYDAEIANERRLMHEANSNLRLPILNELHHYLDDHNPYVSLLRTFHRANESEDHTNLTLIFKDKVNVINDGAHAHPGRYNRPTAPEIAYIWEANQDELPPEREFVVYPRESEARGRYIRIYQNSSHVEPMSYPIFYPNGEPGFRRFISLTELENRDRIRTCMTMLQFFSSLYWQRADVAFNPFLSSGKLFASHTIDSFLKIESDRLNFIRVNQAALRADTYRGLTDALANEAVQNNCQLGRKVILPSSFEGSARNYAEHYHDAMSLVSRFGCPDLFVTMTANPDWPEIKENLFPGQAAHERPDLVARVFEMKLKRLVELIHKQGIFGKCKAFVYTIEFQKRGLPHVHMIVFLVSSLDTPEKIDLNISAEIPGEENPLLRERVLKHMIHSCLPNRCLDDSGKCKKNFPKKLNNLTIIGEGYPEYRRRPIEPILINNRSVTNAHVVPHNRVLLKMFNCHINVESVKTVKVLAYIFKYIFKGSDRAKVTVSENGLERVINHDEIRNYTDSRYTAAPEAIWRIFKFKMHDKSVPVYRLAIHLPDYQTVRFGENDNLNDALQNVKDTTLLAFFKLNESSPGANHLLYTEVVDHFVWVKNSWRERKRNTGGISRMYFVSPADSERYHIRLLLQHVRGPKSFDDLRTFENVIYETFQEAAIARGLVANDSEWFDCLNEARVFQFPKQLRQLFAQICIFNSPADPKALFDNFLEHMFQDFEFQGMTEVDAKNEAVREIRRYFRLHNKVCDFMPPVYAGRNIEEIDREIELAKFEQMVLTLNIEQRSFFEQVRKQLESPSENNARAFFLDGPGGSGKTYTYEVIISFCRSQGYKVHAFATTGIAADLLPGGRTAHSGFKLPIFVKKDSVSSMKMQDYQAKVVLRPADCLIIDEVSMMDSEYLRIIDDLLKDIMRNSLPFGGKLIIFGGDFRQCPPIIPKGSTRSEAELCIKSNILWSHVRKHSLSTNMRSAEFDDHNQWLLDLGNGNLPTFSLLGAELIEIPKQFIVSDRKALIEAIFSGNVLTNFHDNINSIAQKVILTTTNENAALLNDDILELIPGNSTTYTSIDSLVKEDSNDRLELPVETLNALRLSGFPPHKLNLKQGSIVILLRNFDPSLGLLNGTRLVVRNLYKHSILAEIISGSHRGDTTLLCRFDLITDKEDVSRPFVFKRRQFPIQPAFALTINKAQGQSFGHVGIYLPSPVFSHGQLYVSMSRSRNPLTLKVLVENTTEQGNLKKDDDRVFTKNIVHRNLLD